jgi:hypothetical protein
MTVRDLTREIYNNSLNLFGTRVLDRLLFVLGHLGDLPEVEFAKRPCLANAFLPHRFGGPQMVLSNHSITEAWRGLGGFVLAAAYGLPRPTGTVDYIAAIPRDTVADLEEIARRQRRGLRPQRQGERSNNHAHLRPSLDRGARKLLRIDCKIVPPRPPFPVEKKR